MLPLRGFIFRIFWVLPWAIIHVTWVPFVGDPDLSAALSYVEARKAANHLGLNPSKTPLYTTSFSTQIDTGCFCFGHLVKRPDVRRPLSRCPRLQKSQVLRLTRKVRERKGILALFYIANNSTNSFGLFCCKKGSNAVH